VAFREDVTWLRGDVRDADAMRRAVVGKDLIINCAAHTSHPGSMKDPRYNLQTNCLGVLNLLEALREENAGTRFVQIGTSTQIGHMRHPIIDETHEEFPLDVYSANKMAAEKHTLLYHAAFGIPTTVVRLSNVFGPRASICSSDFGFINFFVGLGLMGKPLTIYGEGEQTRDVLYVRDAVSAILAASVAERALGEVYFAVSHTTTSVKEIATAIADTVGGSVVSIPWPAERKAIEIGDARISNDKIAAHLGWSPTHTNLREGLAETRDYYLQYLDDYLKGQG